MRYKYGNQIILNPSEYGLWCSMKKRCYSKNHTSYKYYGGRGITVCDRWRNSFDAFLEDMGKRPFPKAQIDRRDNDNGYFKENCRWVTRTENMRNRSNIKLSIGKAREIRYKHKTGKFTQKKLSEEYSVTQKLISYILNYKTWREA